jgi:hypothetical protein
MKTILFGICLTIMLVLMGLDIKEYTFIWLSIVVPSMIWFGLCWED